ncbi:MAG: 3-hydroxyacyl-CoA dehydrogenase NAD-binding domain-containing protein [Acidobacteriota bacterium]|nr:3-hydroxyacyl-CoA dehydrogenase NAD-binding domain-containing protein [Acidobacteriota bacterium]
MLDRSTKVAVLGAGTMGAGIAQVASQNGHEVVLFDINREQLDKAEVSLAKIMARQVEKGRMTREQADAVQARIDYVTSLEKLAGSGLVIEAVVENLDIKCKLHADLELLLGPKAVLASNTSSLSIASIGAACEHPDRLLGVHFFNPAPLMPLVEIIPGVATDERVTTATRNLMDAWGKTTVLAKDTPGFIVNRVARPFYGEAIRILEEGVADVATIDWAMTKLGGFRMGPFKLTDFIGHDVNYKVTETVFREFFYDPRYKPSFTQKRLVEAGRLGRKSGHGFYDYSEGAVKPQPDEDETPGREILMRILVMLINEAVDAVFLNIASPEDIEKAMTRGVNYPKGLLAWADELGLKNVLRRLQALQEEYGEDRYRPSPLLKRMVRKGETFFGGNS